MTSKVDLRWKHLPQGEMEEIPERHRSIYIRLIAYCAALSCLLSLVEGIIPQLQMVFLGGHILIGNVLAKVLLLACLVMGCLLNPKLSFRGPLFLGWLVVVLLLIFEVGYLSLACDIPLESILGVYNGSYLLPLAGLLLLIFEGAVSEKTLVRAIVLLFLACAVVGVAQYLTGQPILPTESADGSFEVYSWNFFGQVRAFSFFTSSLGYGIFCSFCGALGVALSKSNRLGGLLLVAASAFACYTTLTRLCYLLFVCACGYALILAFGKGARRGLWQPIAFFALGIATIAQGLSGLARGTASGLQDASSLIDRIEEWTYGYRLLSEATLSHQLFGLGITQNTKFSQAPILIDNAPLALILHIGLVGLLFFSIYFALIWLYLRHEAIVNQQPLIIAAASLWSTVLCSGTFNVVFSSFGAVFALAILCRKSRGGGS